MKDLIKIELTQAREVLDRFLNDDATIARIADAAKIMADAVKAGHKIISCGNGGSMSDASHFAEELTGRYRGDRRPIPAIAISDAPHISCTANDYGYEAIFSRFVEALGNSGDVLLAISTSGNSKNVINAVNVAKSKGIKIIALTGKTGGTLASLADVEIRVPHNGEADRIQEVHIKVIHIFIYLIERELGM
ncbi:MAG: D-sedoheptulose 7-phosphate isomerase [Bacteroidales bacterium]|nr:D-sedoheptulose 7-phosphate isomerase [Bacteroidales bacterium]MBQ2099221.1 D-sedoheptulose 7-phosphate isomerase [Bacteroidales bacterium]